MVRTLGLGLGLAFVFTLALVFGYVCAHERSQVDGTHHDMLLHGMTTAVALTTRVVLVLLLQTFRINIANPSFLPSQNLPNPLQDVLSIRCFAVGDMVLQTPFICGVV